MSWLLNNSIFNNFITNRPNLNSTMATNDSNSGEIHNCVDKNCDGASFGGISLSCSWCTQPTFMSCLTDLPELKFIFHSMMPKIVNTSKPTQSDVVNINNFVTSVFTSNSVFDFVCLECKSRGSFKVIEKNYEDQLIQMRVSMQQLKIMIDEQKNSHSRAIETLSHELQMANDKIKDLADNQNKSSVNDNFADTMKSIEFLVNDMRVNSETQAKNLENLSSAIHLLQSKVNIQPNGLNIEITSPAMHENDGRTDVQDVLLTNTSPEQRGNTVSSNVSHVIGTTSNSIPDLQPPVRNLSEPASSSSSENVYSVYVSKFHTETTCDDIARYVIRKLNVTSDKFKIAMMTTDKMRKRENFSFVSFKISTSFVDIYNKVLDEKTWSSKFKAVPFSPKTPVVNSDIDSKSKKPKVRNLLPPRKAPKKNTESQVNSHGNAKGKNPKSKTDEGRQSEPQSHQSNDSNSTPNQCNGSKDFHCGHHNNSPPGTQPPVKPVDPMPTLQQPPVFLMQHPQYPLYFQPHQQMFQSHRLFPNIPAVPWQ